MCCQNAGGKTSEWLRQLFRHCFYTTRKQLTEMTLATFHRLTRQASYSVCVCVRACVSEKERERQRAISALLSSMGFNATPKTICTQSEDDKSRRQFEPRTGPAADKSNFLLQAPSTPICARVHSSTIRKPSIESAHITAVLSP